MQWWQAHTWRTAETSLGRTGQPGILRGFSALWFAFAFAGPGVVRFFRSLPAPATLVYSFFAAHAVHFAAVVVLLTRFEFSHVSQHPGRAVAVVSGGFLLVLVVTLTATAGPPWAYLHRTTLYTVFLIFFLVFVASPTKLLRSVAHSFFASLVVRSSIRHESTRRLELKLFAEACCPEAPFSLHYLGYLWPGYTPD